MNPLTQIKNTQKVTKLEIASGVSESASWHAKFKHSAYIFAGGLAYTLTEGDLLAVFSQYGEIVDVNLVRDKDTGKSRGFAFLAYEDQRSTVLAVDNLSGARVAGRVITVNHVDNYKVKRAEVEGRPVSDSDGDEEEPDEAAEEAAVRAAELDGAQVERIESGNRAGGSGNGQAPGDAPWLDKSSVFALLHEDVSKPPQKRPQPDHILDPIEEGRPKKQKKGKDKKGRKDRKEKKEKKAKKEHKEGRRRDA